MVPAVLAAVALLASPAGAVAGRVALAGTAPRAAPLPATRDPKICGTSKPDESLVVGERNGLQNAVVWLEDVPIRGKLPGKRDHKPRLDQQGCSFVPHVLAAARDSWIEISNGDPLLHNVRALGVADASGGKAAEARLFNYAMPIQGHLVPTHLDKAGFYSVGCDVHPWMRAWLAVLPTTAFAVTGADGSFRIAEVPAGKHTLKVWHEKLGERTQEIEVSAGETARADLSMAAQ